MERNGPQRRRMGRPRERLFAAASGTAVASGAAAAAVEAEAEAADVVVDDDPRLDPMMALLLRTEQKIDSLPARAEEVVGSPGGGLEEEEGGSAGGVVGGVYVASPADPSRKRRRAVASPQADGGDDRDPDGKRPRAKRINWSKSPHRERLSSTLSDWFSRTGRAIDDATGEPIQDYKRYAAKVGIPHSTFFKYARADPGRRRAIPLRGDGRPNRGHRRLIDEEGVEFAVAELRSKADVARDGFTRKEAAEMIMERFGLSLGAAERQLARHILPAMMDDCGGPASNFDQQIFTTQLSAGHRSIVVSGVDGWMGRALFRRFYSLGHDVVGCSRRESDELVALRADLPDAQIDEVDTSDDQAVGRWAAALDAAGVRPNLIVAAQDICLEASHEQDGIPPWEVPSEDFDRTIDDNVKSVANMVRHFVPRLIQHCSSPRVKGSVGGAFVAMSSSLGRKPHPHCAAYSASKFALEGLVKSVAMSLPDPLCAVTLAPGLETMEKGRKEEPESFSFDRMEEWAQISASMVLRFNRIGNGKSMSVKGFYTLRERQKWVIQDGIGL